MVFVVPAKHSHLLVHSLSISGQTGFIWLRKGACSYLLEIFPFVQTSLTVLQKNRNVAIENSVIHNELKNWFLTRWGFPSRVMIRRGMIPFKGWPGSIAGDWARWIIARWGCFPAMPHPKAMLCWISGCSCRSSGSIWCLIVQNMFPPQNTVVVKLTFQ